MLVAIDAVGIRGHGAAAILRELLQWLPRVRPSWVWHVFLFDRALREFDDPIVPSQVVIEATHYGNSGLSRLRWVRSLLPQRLQELRVDTLFSFANLSPLQHLLPQVLFFHQFNALGGAGLAWYELTKRIRMRVLLHQVLASARASSAVIVQTRQMRDGLISYDSSLRERVHVIPSPYCGTGECSEPRPEKVDLITHSSRPRLIYLSYPSEHKNHLLLVDAMAVIRSHIPDASLLLTLESSYEKNDRFMRFSTSIAERAAKTGVREAIVWLGELRGCEVTYALSQADLLVFPSLAESFGLPLVEAMVAGCPIAASDLPYAREVTAGVGVFFDPKVPSEIARAAIEILRNVDLAKDLARRGIERASHFSGGGIADRICAVIETVQARWHHGLDRHYRNV